MFRIAGITRKGFDVLAEALSGKTLSFTRMEYGSGILPGLENIVADSETLEKYKEFIKENPEPTEQQILEMLRTEATDIETKTLILDVESLVSKKGDIGLYEAVSDNGITTLTGKVVDSSVSVDFRARELGVYAQVEEGEEVLFAYFSAVDFLSGDINDTSDFISASELQGQDHRVSVELATGHATDFVIEYNPDVFVTKQELDSEVKKIVDKEIGDIDFSNIIQFDHVVDSNESFLEWANCSDMSMKTVLIKSGTWALSDKMINCLKTGTKYIFGLPGAKLRFNYQKGIGVGEASVEKFVIENVDVEINNTSDSYDGYAIYYGGKAKNCNFKVVSTLRNSYGIIGCSADDCTASGISRATDGQGYGFYDCNYCVRCRAGSDSSTTAAWGGINTFIDSESCDYSVA